MAAVPPQGNGKFLKRLTNDYKKNFFRYGVFGLLILEILSIQMTYIENYTYFWYPLLTQIALFIMVFPQWVLGGVFKYCTRKRIAFCFLSIYYFTGIIYLVLGLTDNVYYDIISSISIVGAGICALLTIFKNE